MPNFFQKVGNDRYQQNFEIFTYVKKRTNKKKLNSGISLYKEKF